jgi:hypothetical protein
MRYILIVLIGFTFIACKNDYDKSFFNETLGLNIKSVESLYSWEELSSLQGEGLSIDIFTYTNVDDALLIKEPFIYPIDKDNKIWKTYKWSKEPKTKEELELLYNYKIDNSIVQEKINEIITLIEKGKNYYSYYAKEVDDNQISIELYIVDDDNKKIYSYYVSV